MGLAFLFGSQACGTATSNSDTDIAVYFIPLDDQRLEYESDMVYPDEDEIWDDLENFTGTEVELIVLNRAAPMIASSALRGVPLLVRDWNLYVDLLLVATGDAEDIREALFSNFLKEKERA